MAIAAGIAWGRPRELIPLFDLFGILLAAGAGYLVGEMISRSVKRKRGLALQAIRGICFAVSYSVSNVGISESALTFRFSPYGILALVAGVLVVISPLRRIQVGFSQPR